MWLFVIIAFAILLFFIFKHQPELIPKNIRRDLRGLQVFLLILIHGVRKYRRSVVENFNQVVKKHPHKVILYFEDEIWTSSRIKNVSNQFACYFEKQGYRKGDTIGLIMDNRPEYICIWLGLSQLGVITALINTNLVKDPLIHSITVAKCKAVICGSNYVTTVANVINNFENSKVYQFTEKENEEIFPQFIDLKQEMKNVDGETFESKIQLSGSDPLFYVYTSGTTGLPKAAVLTHTRFNLLTSMGLILPSNSVIYCPLPLYHASGGILAIGPGLVFAHTVVIRKKFSASNYWKDCAKYNCNAAQYIGEMCRYLLSVPQSNVRHPVKIIFGNGLKTQIWKEFVKKFNIEQVYEFYGSTEGNAVLVNLDNTVGSVGHIPTLLKCIYEPVLVKFDEETGEPLRNEEGHCIKSKTREPGMMIVKINAKSPLTDFKGYTNERDTSKKILRDVFTSGDRYFNSGDTFQLDEMGYFYFLDRTGDTFRWKGENVSTSEVEGVISNIIQLNDAVVFGVQIPGTEGRAGMAAIAGQNEAFNIDDLIKAFKNNLPSYAIPLFVRVMDTLPLTTTFKLQKTQLRSEGFDINLVKDKIYFYDGSCGKYIVLTTDVHQKILDGKMKL